MKTRALLSALAFLATFALASTAFGDGGHKKAAGSAGLSRFKELAGDWVGKMSDDGKNETPVTVKYSVTSGGSAVVETMGPGTDHEMVTVIHQDGKQLGLTHYCSIGNQPNMKADVKGDGKEVDFQFSSGSNMDAAKDMHMHAVKYTFVDNDTLRSEWTTFSDGKKMGTAIFEVKRKK